MLAIVRLRETPLGGDGAARVLKEEEGGIFRDGLRGLERGSGRSVMEK